jgi:hypothetical protein
VKAAFFSFFVEGEAFSFSQHEYHDAAQLSSDQMNGNFMKVSQCLTVHPRKVQPILILNAALITAASIFS